MTRTLIATSIALATLLAAPGHADTTVRDHRTPTVTVRDHRTPDPVVRDHRTSRPNEVVIVGQGEYDCADGEIRLQRMGYQSVAAYDCDGAIYHYFALDRASVFRAAMSSHSGEIRLELIALAN